MKPRQFLRLLTLVLPVMIFLLSGASVRAATADNIKNLIAEESIATDVPASLALALAKTGANFRPDFQGPKGARGVMQILPETAESLGVTPAALWQPRRNVQLGLEILSHLLKRTEGDWAEAVAAYNSHLFKPGGTAANRRVAAVLKWERRYAEQLALRDPIEGRRRDVLGITADAHTAAGHDRWHDDWQDAPPPAEPSIDDRIAHAPPIDTWLGDTDEHSSEREVEIIVIERIEQRPIIVHAPPPPPEHWFGGDRRPRAAPPRWQPRWERRERRRLRRLERARRGRSM